MGLESYEKMLEEAMGKLPKKSEAVSRFKMPQVKSSEQGNKTIIQNFSEIVSTLRRGEKHLAKYLFRELALPGTFQDTQLVLHGIVRGADLQKRLESYVNEFVLCKACDNPDTKIVSDGRANYISCDACGSKAAVRSL